jgi:hypothetical protein
MFSGGFSIFQACQQPHHGEDISVTAKQRQKAEGKRLKAPDPDMFDPDTVGKNSFLAQAC